MSLRSWCTNLWYQNERPRGCLSVPVTGHSTSAAARAANSAPASGATECVPPVVLLMAALVAAVAS